MLNADKPHLWDADSAASVRMYNDWFTLFAPEAYRRARADVAVRVDRAMRCTNFLRSLTPAVLRAHPDILPTLRMATAPPVARDRLIGLAGVGSGLVGAMERGLLPRGLSPAALDEQLGRICAVLGGLLDGGLFPWLKSGGVPSRVARQRAATVIADRFCGALADPIVRNAQEFRQLAVVEEYLVGKGYEKRAHPSSVPLTQMRPGTFTFRLNVVVGMSNRVNIPVDAVIQPHVPRSGGFPVLIEAKSAGDFTNTNKRRKEEATKAHQLRGTYGPDTTLVLFLCGYFDRGYLNYEAAEGLDWAWEHRVSDLGGLGL